MSNLDRIIRIKVFYNLLETLHKLFYFIVLYFRILQCKVIIQV